MSGRITERFREIVEMEWSEFRELEMNEDGSNFDTIVMSLVRACKKGNLRAIQTALDRLDGKIAAEIEVEFPKFFTLYPNATKTTDDPSIITIPAPMLSVPTLAPTPVVAPTDSDEPPTGSLRGTLERMLEAPKKTVDDILGWSEKVDGGDLTYGNPYVKSVIVAGLMKLVHDGRVSAVFEVFDQIDGKVADKIKLLGDDVYSFNYSLIAPAGAEKNGDGIYQVANDNLTNSWAIRLEETNNGKRR